MRLHAHLCFVRYTFSKYSLTHKTVTSRKSTELAADLFLGHQLCFALYAASLAMTKTYRPLLAPLGLTYPQYVVMMALWQHRSMAAGALAQTVALDAGTLVPVLRKLVTKELVKRERSSLDDRSVILSLTASGSALQQQAHAVHRQVALSTQCSAPQRKALTAELQALRASLITSL